jgi:hypothetical protein
MPWITTKSGKRVNTDWFDDDAKQKERQIKANADEGKKVTTAKKAEKSRVPAKQLEVEDKIRNEKVEHLYYLDAEGNTILNYKGYSGDEVSMQNDEDNNFNRLVERAIWDGKEINVTHNHTEDIIFSDSDIESFTGLEAKSLSATIPGGGAYRLIREQPISKSNDPRGVPHFKLDGSVEYVPDFTSKYSPLSLAEVYKKTYRDIWDEPIKKIKETYKPKTPEREKAINDLVASCTKTMSKWLEDNASDYGFTFIKEKK